MCCTCLATKYSSEVVCVDTVRVRTARLTFLEGDAVSGLKIWGGRCRFLVIFEKSVLGDRFSELERQ